jgi:hypothetical protein
VEVDTILRRVERTAVLLCVVMCLAAFLLSGGRSRPALAVVAGGLLVSVSYRLILMGAGVLGADSGAANASTGRRPLLTGAKVGGRYALLAVLAYVMIARLRLPPVGLLAGASSIVAAVSVEALRYLLKKTP